MTLDDLWHYLQGYARIRVTGPSVERFLNLATTQGLPLWATRRRGRVLEANLSLADFRRLRPIARRTGARVRVIGRRGFPFLVGRARRRPLLVAGAVLSLVALYLASATVWFVRVEGAEGLDAGLIREVASSYGLVPGAFKSSFDRAEVERGLMLGVHGISWAAVEVHGSMAVIKIVERDPLEMPDFPTPPTDLVAARDGVLGSLIVLAGTPVVREGDTVTAGDLLVVGHQPGTGDVVAQAIAKARVWYSAYAEVRLHTLTHEPTGLVWKRHDLQLGSARIPLWGWWTRPEGLYERSVERLGLPWRGSGGWQAELVTTTYTQVRDVRQDLTPAEAESLAREAALTALAGQLPEGVVPAEYSFEVTVRNDILIGVLATAETLENIAQPKPRH